MLVKVRKEKELLAYFSQIFPTRASNVPGNVILYLRSRDRHHGNRLGGRQPVRTIATTGIVASVAGITEEERHCRELSYARAGVTCFKIIFVTMNSDRMFDRPPPISANSCRFNTLSASQFWKTILFAQIETSIKY